MSISKGDIYWEKTTYSLLLRNFFSCEVSLGVSLKIDANHIVALFPKICILFVHLEKKCVFCELYTFYNHVCSTNGKSLKIQFQPYQILKIKQIFTYGASIITEFAFFYHFRTLGGCLDENSRCYTLEVSFFSYQTSSVGQAMPYTEEACIL